MKVKIITMFAWLCFVGFPVMAAKYTIPTGSNVVGEMKVVTARQGDTLNRIAMRHGVGYNEIKRANRQLRRKKLRAGTEVVVPTAYRLPNASRKGIVINLAEMRLYYFPNASTVVTYPVAVGKSGWATPQGYTRITQKKRNPTWTPPKSIIKEAAKKGKKLKKVYPAGPNNPLGTRAMRLGLPGILIHGTNKPWTIGQRRSHGCIRMRKRDVESLFNMVHVGTPVKIINKKSPMLALPDVAPPMTAEQQIAEMERSIDSFIPAEMNVSQFPLDSEAAVSINQYRDNVGQTTYQNEINQIDLAYEHSLASADSYGVQVLDTNVGDSYALDTGQRQTTHVGPALLPSGQNFSASHEVNALGSMFSE